VEAVDVGIPVKLDIVAARADVQVERERSLQEASEVKEHLAFALTREIPDQADARLQVVLEVVKSDVGSGRPESLLVIPAQAEVKLDVLRQLVIVLKVEALDPRLRGRVARVQQKVADADA